MSVPGGPFQGPPGGCLVVVKHGEVVRHYQSSLGAHGGAAALANWAALCYGVVRVLFRSETWRRAERARAGWVRASPTIRIGECQSLSES